MKELLELAVDLAERAGEITMEYFRKDLKVEEKSDLSPVTIADREAEEFLRAELGRRFPDDGIVGEEFGETPGRSGRRWIIDPIDGTKSFIRGVPMYGTLLALEDQGRATIGVVHFPPSGETMSALSGFGCFYNGIACQVAKVARVEDALALTTDPKHVAQFLGEDRLARLVMSPKLVRTWGDCYGYMLVATGRADVMVDPIVNWWDVAPMVPIIQEAGGVIGGLRGETGSAMKSCVAANPALQAAMVALLA